MFGMSQSMLRSSQLIGSNDNDTQLLPSQVFHDWHAKKSTRNEQSCTVYREPGLDSTVASVTSSTASQSEDEGANVVSSDDGLSDSRVCFHEDITSPATFLSPNTPFIGGEHTVLPTHIARSSKRSPARDLQTLFTVNARNPGTDLSQIFCQTQAPTSPVQDNAVAVSPSVQEYWRPIKRRRVRRGPMSPRQSPDIGQNYQTTQASRRELVLETDARKQDAVSQAEHVTKAMRSIARPDSTDKMFGNYSLRASNSTTSSINIPNIDGATQVVNVVDSQQEIQNSAPINIQNRLNSLPLPRLPLEDSQNLLGPPSSSSGLHKSIQESSSIPFPRPTSSPLHILIKDVEDDINSSPPATNVSENTGHIAKADDSVKHKTDTSLITRTEDQTAFEDISRTPSNQVKTRRSPMKTHDEAASKRPLSRKRPLNQKPGVNSDFLTPQKDQNQATSNNGHEADLTNNTYGKRTTTDSLLNSRSTLGAQATCKSKERPPVRPSNAQSRRSSRSRIRTRKSRTSDTSMCNEPETGNECLKSVTVSTSKQVVSSGPRSGTFVAATNRAQSNRSGSFNGALSALSRRNSTPAPSNPFQVSPIAPLRVFAIFEGVHRTAYYPGTVVREQDFASPSLLVRFDDGNLAEVKRHLVLCLILKTGDVVKVDANNLRAHKFIIRGFGNHMDGEISNGPPFQRTDVYGYETVFLERKQQCLPQGLEESVKHEEIQISSLYITADLLARYIGREWDTKGMSSELENISRPASAVGEITWKIAPTSRSRRRTSRANFGVGTDLPLESPRKSVGLFANMIFGITFVGEDDTAKTRISKLIHNNGGHVLREGFDDLFENSDALQSASRDIVCGELLQMTELTPRASAINAGFTALITDHYSRKAKYMQALALNLPCISGRWIIDCVDQNQILQWSQYLLPAGESTVLAGAIRSRTALTFDNALSLSLKTMIGNRLKLLAGQDILLVLGRGRLEQRRKAHLFLTQALAPRHVLRVSSVAAAKGVLLENCNSFQWVYVHDDNLAKAQNELNHPNVVGHEFVMQSLILGSLLQSRAGDETNSISL